MTAFLNLRGQNRPDAARPHPQQAPQHSVQKEKTT